MFCEYVKTEKIFPKSKGTQSAISSLPRITRIYKENSLKRTTDYQKKKDRLKAYP